MRTWLARPLDALQSRLWPVPALAVALALLLGLALPELDAAIDPELSGRVSALVFGGDADAARSLLGVIASSLITVTSLTFSLTVVTLQLASSQFSPRLLRTFTSDQFVQWTLALFLATFTYALTVLRAVRSAGDEGQAEFVPQASVTFAFVLAVASVLGLVLFLAHLTATIRVETMLRNVHADATRTLKLVLPERDATATGQLAPEPPPSALQLAVSDDGFLTWVDEQALLEVVLDEAVVVRLDVRPGGFLVKGTPLGFAWTLTGEALDADTAARVQQRVVGCIHTSFERTAAQDVGFGLRQLTDVATKALSPGISDPTTAIHALGHISSFLCDLADRDLGTHLVRDDDDRVRIVISRADFGAYVDLGISQPRRYGASDPQVLEGVVQVLLDLSHRVHPDQRGVVREQLARVRTTIAAQDFDAAELDALSVLGERVEQNLGDSSG